VGDVGGYLYMVTPTAGVTKSGQLDFGVGFAQGPFVDSTAGVVYAFASSDNKGNCAGALTVPRFTRSAILFWLEARGRRCKLERAL